MMCKIRLGPTGPVISYLYNMYNVSVFLYGYFSCRMSNLRSAIMKAVRASQFGGPEVLQVVNDVSIPKPGPSQVRQSCIKVSGYT